MTTTSHLALTLLEVGQKDKEVTINQAFTDIDTKVVRYLGESATDLSVTGVAAGSTYYNTTSSKLKVLKSNSTWVNVA